MRSISDFRPPQSWQLLVPQAVSNQLQRLADRGIVEAERDGLQMRYSILDPCVLALLQQGWCLAEDAKGRSFDRAGGVAS